MKSHANKKGFTLVELLIVTVVIVTLMGVVFRLAGAGSDKRAVAKTIDRMQRIENALSGYYAAFGCYPPVPLQGRSKDISTPVDQYGRQKDGEDASGTVSIKSMATMAQILAACRAQPIGVSWPTSDRDEKMKEMVDDFSKGCIENNSACYSHGFSLLSGTGSVDYDKEVNWRSNKQGGKGVQLFEFGLLSFLLPRYYFMLEAGSDEFYDNKRNGRLYSQWAANNQIPCRLDTGEPYKSWKEIRKFMGAGGSSTQQGSNEAGMISNIVSQAVCARWMPNFKGIVTTVLLPKYCYFFGVDIADRDTTTMDAPGALSPRGIKFDSGGGANATLMGRRIRAYSGGGFSGTGSGGSAYMLTSMTIVDGWGNEFFYSSDPPYQSYRLWSSGPNGVTFPPWYDLGKFSGEELNYIESFISDDIVHLSN